MDPARFPHAPHTLAPDSQIPLCEDPVMERRRFIEAIAGGFLAAPLAAEAQQPRRVYRIALLYAGLPSIGGQGPFEERMRELGWSRDGTSSPSTVRSRANMSVKVIWRPSCSERASTSSSSRVAMTPFWYRR